MKSLGIFVHYSEKNYIPGYVLTYLKELSNYFTDIILSTNLRDINNIDKINQIKCVKLLLFKNEGYDFGLFYKSILSTNINLYDRVAFINDSNILLKPLKDVFEWKKGNDLEMWGLTDSYENVPNSKYQNSYHVQSHFLVFEKSAIFHIYKFFDFIKFNDIFEFEFEKRELWLKIVEDCEIGLSVYMRNNNVKIGSKYECKSFVKKENYKAINIHMRLWKELLDDNYPLIKKKIVNKLFDPVYETNVAKNIDANSADEYIDKYKRKSWDINF